jgi:hypothetical protein
LKYAVVKLSFKKGDKSKIFNYRPIPILSPFSKVLEKVMYNQLQKHLNKYSILAEEQFGFISDSTTNKAIHKLINHLIAKLNPICHLLALLGAHPILHVSRIKVNETLNALNNKFMVFGIFFYLEKACDCLNHNILLSKLQFYSVNGKAKSWFKSYLHN